MMRRLLAVFIIAQLAILARLLTQRLSILGDMWNALSSVGNTIGDAVSAVWNAIQALFHGAEDVFNAVLNAWQWMYNGVLWLGENAVGTITDIVDGIGWLLSTGIPDAAAFAVGWAFNAIKDAVNGLESLIKDAVNAAIHAIMSVVHQVEQWVSDLINLVWKSLNWVLHVLYSVGLFVFDTVIHPEKLVEWIWGAFILKFLSVFWAFAHILARFLFQEIRHNAVDFMRAVEDVMSAAI